MMILMNGTGQRLIFRAQPVVDTTCGWRAEF